MTSIQTKERKHLRRHHHSLLLLFSFHSLLSCVFPSSWLRLDLASDLRLLKALGQVTRLLRVPVHRAWRLAVAVADNHEALPAEHPQEEVEGWGGDVVLAAQLDGAVHHPLDVDEADEHEGAVVGAKEALGARGGRDVLQLRGVVELTTAEAHLGAAEERGLRATKHRVKE